VLSPEQAKTALAALRIEDGYERKWERFQKLPKSPAIRNGFLTEENGAVRHVECGYYHIVSDEQAARIDDLAAPERTRYFDAFFPSLGRHFETVWQFLKRLPYQIGFTHVNLFESRTIRPSLGDGGWGGLSPSSRPCRGSGKMC
jgi:hypothetical protein